MIAELILMLAGHPSSLFLATGKVNPAFGDLLHPGEQNTLEYLCGIAMRYRNLKSTIQTIGNSSEYLSSMSAAIRVVLREYESLVVQTEHRIIRKDSEIVASGSFVPLASLKAVFSEWDAPMLALHALLEHIQVNDPKTMTPGRLIDLLLARSTSGVARVASIMGDLALAVQRVWQMHLIAYLVHASLNPHEPFAHNQPHRLNNDLIPSCVSAEARDSIAYVGRAMFTVKTARSRSNQQQPPRSITVAHSKLLSKVLPQDSREFDSVMAQIRANISEWLWTTVLTRKDVDEALESLSDFFLMRNGEFSVALIREIERLKLSRLTPRPSSRSPGISVIREQDLALALLRASLGTSAEHDPSLSKLKFKLPSGPMRPFLPSFTANPDVSMLSTKSASTDVNFISNLLGTPLELSYSLTWPLDLFLSSTDLHLYTNLFAYFSAVRHSHQRVMACWTTLSNAQRVRRRWVRVGDGGDVDQADGAVRRDLLRCGWGVVREMMWFLDALWAYICTDVVETQYRALKESLGASSQLSGDRSRGIRKRSGSMSSVGSGNASDGDKSNINEVITGRNTPHRGQRSSLGGLSTPKSARAGRPAWSTVGSHKDEQRGGIHSSPTLDFATLRALHSSYLYALNAGSLLANAGCASTIKTIMELCEVFVATIERWGGDILPDLLGGGSLAGEDDSRVLKERWKIVREINTAMDTLLETFYEQLTISLSSQTAQLNGDVTTATMSAFFATPFLSGNISSTGAGAGARGKAKILTVNRGTDAEVRRTAERLLLRLDFNNGFSKIGRSAKAASAGILKEGGLA